MNPGTCPTSCPRLQPVWSGSAWWAKCLWCVFSDSWILSMAFWRHCLCISDLSLAYAWAIFGPYLMLRKEVEDDDVVATGTKVRSHFFMYRNQGIIPIFIWTGRLRVLKLFTLELRHGSNICLKVMRLLKPYQDQVMVSLFYCITASSVEVQGCVYTGTCSPKLKRLG